MEARKRGGVTQFGTGMLLRQITGRLERDCRLLMLITDPMQVISFHCKICHAS
jgi:hypothetical protein